MSDLHLSMDQLLAGLDHIREAPRERGLLAHLVRRPAIGEREVLEEGVLDVSEGLVGDNWRARGSNRTADGSAHPEMQLNLMSARVIALVARTPDRWQLAGDQLFLDMDLSEASLPPGTRLALGAAILEVTAIPHNGCKKFVERFGLAAMEFVNSPLGKQLHLRGINAKVVQTGAVRVGDVATRIG